MAIFDYHYRQVLKDIYWKGFVYEDPNRKGVERKQIAKATLSCNPHEGFPALTTKQVYFKGAVAELLFFMSGSTDIRNLWKMDVRFWDKDWARYHKFTDETIKYLYNAWEYSEIDDRMNRLPDSLYDMGKVYPYQWRKANGVDQLYNLVFNMVTNPMSTSLIVNSWNAGDLVDMCLPPCHYSFQVMCQPVGKRYVFRIIWDQRSTDFFLGTPVNMMFYTLLGHVLEALTGYKCIEVSGELKNVHIYDNQMDVVKEQLDRPVDTYGESKLVLDKSKFKIFIQNPTSLNFDYVIKSLSLSDFKLEGYASYPKLKVEMLSYN
jgi:thymidylate synthase